MQLAPDSRREVGCVGTEQGVVPEVKAAWLDHLPPLQATRNFTTHDGPAASRVLAQRVLGKEGLAVYEKEELARSRTA